MRTKCFSAVLAGLLLAGGIATAAPMGSAFTYNGHLSENGTPVTGLYEFCFSLFDDFTNGTQAGTTVTNACVPVTNDQFPSLAAALQTPGAPLLSVSCTNGSVIVYWPMPASGWVVQTTTNLVSKPIQWTPLAPPYATNSAGFLITEPMPVGNRFYRLMKQF